MKRIFVRKCLGLFVLAVVAAAIAIVGPARADEQPAGKIRVLLTYGGHPFEQGPFFAMFDALPGIVYTKAEMPKAAGLFKPGLEKQYDAIVRYDMVPAVTAEQQQAFVDLLKTGIGLVALHHDIAAHRTWEEYPKIIGAKYFLKDEEYVGKKWSRSVWSHGEDLNITVADKDHPITRGLSDFQIHDETYKGYYVFPHVHVLLKTDHPKNEPTVAWVSEYGRSRVFFLQLGHDHLAWDNPSYREILGRGIRWAAGK